MKGFPTVVFRIGRHEIRIVDADPAKTAMAVGALIFSIATLWLLR